MGGDLRSVVAGAPRGWVRRARRAVLALGAFGCGAAVGADLQPEVAARIDAAAGEVLAVTGTAGASIAVVRDGRIAYLKAFGVAQTKPQEAAEPGTIYAIGSISKQFTAAAVLLLQEDGKLSLDDRVAKYLPGLTRAEDITLRQLLSHTAGYQDYWPQDYVFPLMRTPVRPEDILDRWARKPLDYEPGARWQYSNTGFVAAGRIVEMASGQPLFAFLRARVFEPLGMTSVRDFDREPRGPGVAQGMIRHALGPVRVAEPTGPGWLFGAGQLAMTAEDLAKWNLSLMQRTLLAEASYRALETETLLASGVGAGYGLGVNVEREGQGRRISHGGLVSGFTAQNVVYPDDGAAVVVLVNEDTAPAARMLAGRLTGILEEAARPDEAAKTERARGILEGLQRGRLDRSLLTENANAYFSALVVGDYESSLGGLGAVRDIRETGRWSRGGLEGRSYDVRFSGRSLRISTYEAPGGLLEQFLVQFRE